ncbi:MAG: hypothetical protein IPN29_19045 [Saprospiraceae bacterium]|nr:hypothetical protein [Saprospiraceae bacterium]
MNKNKYADTWLAFVNITAKQNHKFNELIDLEDISSDVSFDGAWANILVKEPDIKKAIDIIHQGLDELYFKVIFIEKIENVSSLIEYDEISDDVLSEVNWLYDSDFVFKISDRLFPYE